MKHKLIKPLKWFTINEIYETTYEPALVNHPTKEKDFLNARDNRGIMRTVPISNFEMIND